MTTIQRTNVHLRVRITVYSQTDDAKIKYQPIHPSIHLPIHQCLQNSTIVATSEKWRAARISVLPQSPRSGGGINATSARSRQNKGVVASHSRPRRAARQPRLHYQHGSRTLPNAIKSRLMHFPPLESTEEGHEESPNHGHDSCCTHTRPA